MDELVGEILGWRPDAVVFHALWLPWLPDALHRGGVGLVLCLDPAQPCDVPGGLRGMDPQAGVLAAILGASDAREAGAVLMREVRNDRFSPSFEYRFVGTDRKIEQTLAFVSLQACPYQAPVGDNPLFRDLDMPEDVSRMGCSYCNGARHYRRMDEAEKLDALRHQVPYLVASLPALEEIAVPFPEDYLDALSALVAEAPALGLRPVTFSGQFRHQVLQEKERSLARLIEACEGTGFEMHINVVGLESLHDPDLMLYNRGDAAGVREAIAVLRRLRSRFDPRRFMPGTVGSFILFHPWQDLAGLQVSLDRMREEGVAGLFSSLNLNDLRFHPGVPLYHLALRDGLVGAIQDGSVQDVPLSGYFTEHPWRFRDPAVASLHAAWKSLGLAAFASRMKTACLPRNGMHRSVGVGSVSDTRPLRPLADGRVFPDDPAVVVRALEGAGSLEGTRVTIWGPEPTMCESLPEVIGAIKARGAGETDLLTYGRRLAYPWYASSIARSGVDTVTFLLHSHDSRSHDDFVRVAGAFEQALLGMRNVAGLGKTPGRPRLGIAAVMGPENVGTVHRIVEVARAVGAREIRLVVPTSGLVLGDPRAMASGLEKILGAADAAGIEVGTDAELSFRWIPLQP